MPETKQQITATVRFDFNGTLNGLKLDLTKPSQLLIWNSVLKGGYEPETVSIIRKHLRPGDTFVDVGAHVGFFTVLASAIAGRNGKVIAFEADTDNYSQLVGNVAHLENVTAVHTVISSFDGPVTFHKCLDNDGGNSIWDCGKHPLNVKSKASPSPFITEAHRLDTYDRLEAGADVIKIDTEGAEYDVLLGAEQLLANDRLRLVICELNGFGLQQMGHSGNDIVKLMQDCGFTLQLFDMEQAKKYIINLFFTR